MRKQLTNGEGLAEAVFGQKRANVAIEIQFRRRDQFRYRCRRECLCDGIRVDRCETETASIVDVGVSAREFEEDVGLAEELIPRPRRSRSGKEFTGIQH
jgi:hypothetical protein